MEPYTPPCDECGGSCCKYVAIEIDKPTCKADYDNVRWYLVHRDVNVFIDHEKKWYIEFKTPCIHQGDDNRCGIYEDRPKICRSHGNEEGGCEYYSSPYSEYFESEEKFIDYLEKKNINWKFKK